MATPKEETKKSRGNNSRNSRIAGWKDRVREIRKTEAEQRQNNHSKLSTQQKIEKLNTKLGVNIGAVKERSRLLGV